MMIIDGPEQTILVDVLEEDTTSGTLAVFGDLDMSGAVALDAAVDALPRTTAVELDLGGVEFMDCSGLRAVLRCRALRMTTVVNPSRAVVRICELTRLQYVLDLH